TVSTGTPIQSESPVVTPPLYGNGSSDRSNRRYASKYPSRGSRNTTSTRPRLMPRSANRSTSRFAPACDWPARSTSREPGTACNTAVHASKQASEIFAALFRQPKVNPGCDAAGSGVTDGADSGGAYTHA